MNQQTIRSENKQLRNLIQNYMDEIQRLKEVNEQHEGEIETLLKFNERLLTIIETELNQYNSKKSERSFSLQPISEITERDSQYADGVQSIKASLLSNFRLEIPEIQERNMGDKFERRSGRETERLCLGNNLDDVVSYEGARSDYQKQFSSDFKEPSHKVKEVVALIGAYRKQYGKSVEEYDNVKKKIRNEVESENQEIKNLNQKNEYFYEQKLSKMNELKNSMQNNTTSKQLESLIKGNQYSVGTQNKLMKLMNSIKS